MTRTITATVATLLLVLAWAAPAPAKDKDELPSARQKDEIDYVDTEEEAEASKLLEKLTQKYDAPKEVFKLLEILREKRRFPRRVPDRLTFDVTCTDGKVRQVTWIAPSKRSRRKKVGVLVFLHGAISQPAPGGGANEAGMFAPAVRDLDVVMVGPSTYDRVGWGDPACRDLIDHALRVVKRTFDVDEDRVYLAGDSDGGRGTYAVLETEATFFASAVPVIGAPGGVTRFANLLNVPIFAINGDKDTIFTIDHVHQLVEAMKTIGVDLTYKEIAGGGHDPRYFLTYKDEVCRFLEDHPREPFPEVVRWELDPDRKDHDGGFPADTFRWIRILEAGPTESNAAFDGPTAGILRSSFPRIEARREGNRIDVKTRGVKRYAVLVSPDMLDLGKNVEIHTNGHLSWKGKPTPSARVLLEEARRFMDRRLLFVARIEVDVDAIPAETPEAKDDEP